MNSDLLTASLTAAAQEVLARPSYNGPEADAAQLVLAKREWLLELMKRSPSLRAAAQARLAPSARAACLLFLHPDPKVAGAALALAGSMPMPHTGNGEALAERKVRRLANQYEDLKKRLRTSEGRLNYARADIDRLTAELTDTREAAASAQEDAANLQARLAAEQRRLSEPKALAAALLVALAERPDTGIEEQAAHRDPRYLEHSERSSPAAPDPIAVAAAAAGIEPAVLTAALQAIVEPPLPAPTRAAVRSRELHITPLGGDDHIGGSCLLIATGDTRILIDAGLRPGDPAQPPRDIEQALGGPLDAVVITHAHTDHCGYVPALAEAMAGLRIIATSETCKLMPIMWQDSLKLMQQRVTRLRSHGSDWAPLFFQSGFDAAAERLEELAYGVPRRIGDLTIELFRAGHILGAAGVVVRAGEHRVVVTGDISGFRQRSVDGYAIPDAARDADLLIVESTCCAEDHGRRDDRVTHLTRAVEEVYSAGGRVLIPAFALGRAQELALVMRQELPHIPVLVDGMARQISTAFESATASHAVPLQIFEGNVTARRPEDLDEFKRGVVITTSGMLTGGPAVEWAARILPETHSALFISGYQDEESSGRQLLDNDGREFILNTYRGEQSIPVRARVEQIRLSAHADRRGLLEIADEVSARQIMLVHGTIQRQRNFREVLRIRGHQTAETGPWRLS